MRKVFFNPKKNGSVPFRMTPVPVETDNGIVHTFVSNDELSKQVGISDCMLLDPAFLVSKGVNPIGFSGSVISPLDAVHTLTNNVYNLDLNMINDNNDSETITNNPESVIVDSKDDH